MARTRHHGDRAKERAFGAGWRWFGNYPGWWDTLMHHAPARRKLRDRLTATLRGAEVTDWPDHRKPHSYWW